MSINIYLVCRGLSCNDIIESLKKDITKTQSFFNFLGENNNKQLKLEEFPRLDTIGIKEILINISNENNIEYLDIKKNNPLILTSLEYCSIESALVLYHMNPDRVIFPICNLSSKTNIKNQKTLDTYKRKFGYGYNNEKLLDKYWDEKKIINNLYKNIGGRVPKINWEFIDNEKNHMTTYSLSNFMDFLKRISENSKFANRNIIVICDSKLILDIFKKSKKYDKKEFIEYSSIWKLELQSYNKITDFKKIYPTEFNHKKPLIYDDGIYKYEFDKKKFILFNSLKPIPMNYLKIAIYRCLSDKNNILTKIFENIRENKKNEKYEKDVKKNNNSLNDNSLYENILKKELNK